ncbi:Down syndrome cell adhesion molecule, partial [Araneus ventricosus]
MVLCNERLKTPRWKIELTSNHFFRNVIHIDEPDKSSFSDLCLKAL